MTSISVNLILLIYFFVNLLHSQGVSFFYIWHLFDNLTSINIFITCICTMGEGNNFTSVCLFTGGYLVYLGIPIPAWGYLPCPGRYLTWLGVLTFAWSTYPGKGATYLCKGVWYLPWLGRYLPWTGGTYPGLGRYLPFLEGYLHWAWEYLP